ncbi:hypothetical protein QMK33_21745 [Hymenobacter sp. H14-R3]|uniref:hypothetical protein n=1 Tax=Hymenobacter sp. H14-R3 TaxID=3046308 RepID=UPI0024BBD9BE|nr:hypothetical protein [Hymenobacter sp. H14-R3]MDJ0367778.1 hypothetical protein [Hymenobacter sp. H14-R3]
MSKLLLAVLGNYNQQLSATLTQAEERWSGLSIIEDKVLSEEEVEERRRTLLLAMAYLDQLKQLLNRHANQSGAMAP